MAKPRKKRRYPLLRNACKWRQGGQRRKSVSFAQKMNERAAMMRAKPTPHEAMLWNCLQKKRCDGIPFKSQFVWGPYILDFYAPDIGLVVEVDGRGHKYGRQRRKDKFRDTLLAADGNWVLRFSNDEVLDELPKVVKIIKETAHAIISGKSDANSKEREESPQASESAEVIPEIQPTLF